VLGYPDIADGIPPDVLAALLAIIQDVTFRKAGGVNVDLELKEATDEVARGHTNANSFTLVWTLTPPGGTIWAVQESFAGHDSATVPTGTHLHHLQFDFEDGSTFQTPDAAVSWTERLGPMPQRVTAVRGYVRSDGALDIGLVGDIRVIQMVL
jgi:hypothetical protein